MRVLLDPELDVEGWTGQRRGESRFGVHEVGPLGLARALATRLGLNPRTESRALRVAALATRLERSENVRARYQRAARLLAARDALVMSGARPGDLDGDVLARPRALLEMSARLADGPAELLARVADADLSRAGVQAVTLLSPREGLPGLTRRALARLEEAGVDVSWRPHALGRAAGDLGEAQAGSMIFRDDDTLRVERAAGPWTLAERAARAIATGIDDGLFELDDVLIVEPSEELASALEVYGLPRTPVRGPVGGRAREDLLALLALFGLLSRPARAADLRCCASFAPLLPSTRGRLLALVERHIAPRQVFLDEELVALSDADPVLRALIPSDTPRSWESVRHRLAVFTRWVKRPEARVFASQVRAAIVMAERAGEELSALEPLVEVCARATPGQSDEGEAGFGIAKSAGAVLADADVVVWTLTARPTADATPWDDDERAALDARGFVLPPTELAQRRASRPLEHARERLWIFALDGVTHSTVDRLPSARLRREVAPPARAPEVPPWRVHIEAEQLQRPRSPSALTRFLDCPLRYSLERVSSSHEEPAGRESMLARHVGVLAHEIIGAWLCHEDPAASARAALFDVVGVERAERLLNKIDRAKLTLQRIIEDAGAEVLGVELEANDELLEGRADLVIAKDDQRAVIDLKWSGAARWRRELREGVAQLLVYGRLFDARALGIFVIDEATLLTVGDALDIPGAERVQAQARADEALEHLLKNVDDAWREHSAGTWRAPPTAGHSTRPCAGCPWDEVCGVRRRA